MLSVIETIKLQAVSYWNYQITGCQVLKLSNYTLSVIEIRKNYASAEQAPSKCTYHIDTWLRTVSGISIYARLVVNAWISTPSALIFRFTCNTQAAIGMLTMRSQYVAFVQRYRDRIDVMIAVPVNVDLCFVLVRAGLVRVRCFLANNILIRFDACRQRHMRPFDINDAQKSGMSTLWSW